MKKILLTSFATIIAIILFACVEIDNTTSSEVSAEAEASALAESGIEPGDQSDTINSSDNGSTPKEASSPAASVESTSSDDTSEPVSEASYDFSDAEGYFCGYEIVRFLADGEFISVKREDEKIALFNKNRSLVFDFRPRFYFEIDEYILVYYMHIPDTGEMGSAANVAVLDLSGNFIIDFNTYNHIHYTGEMFCAQLKTSSKHILLELNGEALKTDFVFDSYRMGPDTSLNLNIDDIIYLAYRDFNTGKILIEQIDYDKFAKDNYVKLETLFNKFIDAAKNKNLPELKKLCGDVLYKKFYDYIKNKEQDSIVNTIYEKFETKTPLSETNFNPERYDNGLRYVNPKKNGITNIHIFWAKPEEYPIWWFIYFRTTETGSIVIDDLGRDGT